MTAALNLKPSIPGTNMLDPTLAVYINPMKENIEIITGVRRGSQVLTQLPATATLSDVILLLNQVVMRLNARGA